METPLHLPVLATFVFLSPVVVFGAFVSVSTYSSGDFLYIVWLIHCYTFEIFSEFKWSMPSFYLDPSLVVHIPAYIVEYIKYLWNLGELTSLELLEGSQALMAVASLVSFIRPMICCVAVILSTFDCMNVSRNASIGEEMRTPLDMRYAHLIGRNGRILQTKAALESIQDSPGQVFSEFITTGVELPVAHVHDVARAAPT